MSADHHVTVYGTAILVCAPDGPAIPDQTGAAELIGAALSGRVALVAIPAERLGEDFFDVRSGVATDLAQRFANHSVGLAIIGGDIAPALQDSGSLGFYPTFDDLCTRLDRRKTAR